MYDWLLKKDKYTPKQDRDIFLSNNILTIVGILSNLRRKKSDDNSWIYDVNILLKIIFTLIFVVSLSLTRNAVYAVSVNAYMFFFLLFVNKYERSRIIKLFFSAIVFSVLIVVPSLFFYSSIYNAGLLVLRISGSIMCVNVLVYSCLPHQITASFNKWFVPDVIVMIFDLTLKYIVVLGDCAIEMFQALTLKSVGVNREKSRTTFNIFGVLFLKSKIYSEDLYNAMVCRCFDGEYPNSYQKGFKIKFNDICYATLSTLVLCVTLL